MKKLLLILLPLLAAMGCSRSPMERLRAADALMEANPDSAMVLLRATDRAGFSAADSAYYALLFTQAQIKTNVHLTSDSLISLALEAYRFSPDPDLRMRAHFYAAQVALYSASLPPAMKNITVAYDIAKNNDDPYWIAKCAELTSDIYKELYNYPQAEKYILETIYNYGRAGKIRNQRYSLCDLATNYINLDQSQRCINIIDSIRQVISQETPFDSDLDNYALGVLMKAVLRTNNYDKLEELLANYKNHSSLEEQLSDALLRSCIDASRGDSASVASYLFEAYNLSDSEKERVRVIYAAYANALKLHNYKEAALLSDTIIAMQSEIAKKILFESVSSIPNDYYINETRFQRQHARFIELCLWGAGVMIAIILICGTLLYQQRLKTRNAEFEANLAAITQYKIQAEESRGNIESLLKEKGAMLSKLCEEYYELGPTAKARQRIVQLVDDELKKLRTPDAILELEKTNDKYIGGIIHDSRIQCSFLSESELQLLSLILNKYPVRTICVVLDIKYKNFYLKKSRIIKKISDSNISVKAELLNRLRNLN